MDEIERGEEQMEVRRGAKEGIEEILPLVFSQDV